MEQELREQFTIIISSHDDNFHGIALKNTKNGLFPKPLANQELKFMTLLPNIKRELEQEKILQMHYRDRNFHLQIGKVKTEGEYCETSYLEVSTEQKSPYLLTALTDLENKLNKKEGKNCVLRKAYKVGNKYE